MISLTDVLLVAFTTAGLFSVAFRLGEMSTRKTASFVAVYMIMLIVVATLWYLAAIWFLSR
jgi:hypothetical protein